MTKPTSSSEVLTFLASRRSSKPALLSAPGPSAEELAQILTIASRVPDHKKLAPWRFIVFEGDARRKFGEVLAEVCAREEKAPSEARLTTERERFLSAPLVIAVVSAPVQTTAVPEIEQTLSAGAATFSICLAANAMGYATSWLTQWYAFSPGVRAALDLAPSERFAGFVYIGTAKERQAERDRPDLSRIVMRYGA